MTICRCGLAHAYHAERFHLVDHEYVPRYGATLDPDDLRAPGTDDEPWTVPDPDPPAARRDWAQTLALAVLIVALVVVAIVWRR